MKLLINVSLIFTLFLILAVSSSAQKITMCEISKNLQEEILPGPNNLIQDYNPSVGMYRNKIGANSLKVINAKLNMPILGKVSDVNGSIDKLVINNDIIKMSLYYTRREHPCYIRLSTSIKLKSYSNEKNKYRDNNNLSIYSDGKLIFSKQIELQTSIGMVEIFYLEVKPEDFDKMLKSRKIMIQLGNTKVYLQEKELNALNDLSDLIPPLDYQKIYAEGPGPCSPME